MTVEAGRHTTWLLDAFLEAGSLLGYPLRDPNSLVGNTQLGFAPYLFTIKDGQRLTTADAYLRPALERRQNLNVALNAHVRKITFDGKDQRTAKGVQFTMNGGYSVIEVSWKFFLTYRVPQINMTEDFSPKALVLVTIRLSASSECQLI